MKSSSCEGGKKKRKKPLAVAVGFNYANDVNGRPIVITPGSRRPLNAIDLTRSRSGRSSNSGGKTSAKMPAQTGVPFDEAREGGVSIS